MKITTRSNLEDCFDGGFVVLYTFDNHWTKDAIHSLKILGQLTYYGSFPRPMFQLTCSDGIFAKGVQGTNECRVIYNRNGTAEANKRFEKRFEDSIHSF